MANCSAVIGKTSDAVLYTTVTTDYQVIMNNVYNTVLDNVKLNGTRVNQYSTGTQHGPNDYGIFVYN